MPNLRNISFGWKRMNLLKYVISKEGISVDPGKIKAVVEWSRPKTVTKVWSFLGPTRYYGSFMKAFSKIATPMTSLTQKKEKFD